MLRPLFAKFYLYTNMLLHIITPLQKTNPSTNPNLATVGVNDIDAPKIRNKL